MIVKKLIALADSLDKKGHRDLASSVDEILRTYAEELAPEGDASAEDAPEEPAEESEEVVEEDSEESEEVAPPVPAAPVAPSGEGMLGKSWYGEKGMDGADLSPPPPGTMLDKRDPSFSCGDQAAAPAPEEGAEGDLADDADADEAAMTPYKIEVANLLVSLADSLDKKGLVAEASFVDKVCKEVVG